MVKEYLIIISILIFSASAHADCRGCCSGRGGVVCVDGVTRCRDGLPLSIKCAEKQCDKCGLSSEPEDNHPAPYSSVKQENYPDTHLDSNGCSEHLAFGIPGDEDQHLCREGYAVGYDYDKKTPAWVAYHLTQSSVNRKFKRSNKFKPDTEIPAQFRAVLSDYRGSGYDRGHMAASATVDSSHNAMMESFLLSNMTPQLPGFNRQGWRYLEAYIREWTNERDELYVVTGAHFSDSHDIIGNNVHVPTNFFKVVYDPVTQDAIAFWVPHRAISKADIPEFIVSVDDVEKITGLDFNSLLEDSLEDDIEDDVAAMW